MIDQDIWNMQIAYEEAIKAFHEKEVPVGACLVDENGEVIAQACNNREREKNSIGHAEILCIQEACQKLESWRLTNTTLYVTLEPCIMCMGAIHQSRISRIVFGAYDPKGGALSLNYNIHRDKRINHNFGVTGGVLHYQCSQILSKFFREMRQK